MSDDLDELDAALRRAMAALDREAPAGYFDALPERTLARLDDPAIGELPDEPGRLRAVQVRPPPAPAEVGREPDDAGDDEDEDDDDRAVYASQIMSAFTLSDPAEPEPVIAVPGVAAVEDLAARPPSAAATGPVEAPGGAVVPMTSPGRRRSRIRVAAVGIGAVGVAAVAAIYLTAGNHGRRMERPAASMGERSAPETAAASASPDAGGGSAVAAGSAASTAAGSAAAATGSAAQGRGSAAVPESPGKPSVPILRRTGKDKLPTKGGNSRVDAELPGGLTKRGVGKKLESDRPRSDRTALSRDDIERAMTAV